MYSFVTEEYPQVFIKTYQKNLRVPCLFRCLIFKVRCLLKKGRFVSYHIIAALSTPFFCLSGFFTPAPLLPVGIPFQGCALPALFRTPFGSLSKMLDHSIKPLPFCQYLFPPFSPSLYTPPRVARTTGTRLITPSHHRTRAMEWKAAVIGPSSPYYCIEERA